MTLRFWHSPNRYRRPVPRRVLRDLSPHMMRDIGLDPWPERQRLSLRLHW